MNPPIVPPTGAAPASPGPDDIAVLLQRFTALLNGGQISEARQLLLLAQQAGLAPSSLASQWDTLAQAETGLHQLVGLFQAGRHAEFDAAAAAWTQRYPSEPLAWKLLGASLLERGRHQDALAPLQQAATLAPADAECQLNLANAQFLLGQADAARAAYRQAFALAPDAIGRALDFARYQVNAGQLGPAESLLLLLDPLAPGHLERALMHGALLFRQQRWQDAGAQFERALQSAPDHVDALGNLAACLKKQWRFDEALAYCERALALDPHNANVKNNYGAVLVELGRYREAEALLGDMAASSDVPCSVLLNLGTALKEQWRFEEAQAILERAAAIEPDNPEVIASLADLLEREEGVDAARSAYERALAIDPKCTTALVGMGTLLTTIGQFKESEQCFLDAVAVRPTLAAGWAGMAHTRKFTSADQAWFDTVRALLAQRTPQSPAAEVALRFALGKACNDVKLYDEAFDNFARANNLAKDFGTRFSLPMQAAVTDATCAVYSAAMLRGPHPGASTSRRPILVVGMPRSGTSLTEQIIASHPQVYGAGELGFWGHAAARLVPNEGGAALDRDMTAKLARDYLARLQRCSTDADHVVDKMPGNYNNVGLIHSVFPNARIVHIRRNPIDTCLSIYFQNFNISHNYAKDLQDLADRYREYERLMQHWRTALPPGVMLEIDYEDLVADQETHSRRLIEFVGLPWDERCLQFHETERRVGTASNWQVRQKIYTTSKERWRHYEQHIGPLLPLLESQERQ